MNKQNWWMNVSIAMAERLLAGTYEERVGAGHASEEGGVDLEDWGGNHAGAKLW